MTSPRTSKSHLLSARKLMSARGIDSWHLRRLSATESQVFAPCSAEKSHLHCCGTAQPFKRCGTQSPARQQPRLPSATSFVASAREAYRTKDHVKPPSDEASDGSTCAHRQLRSLSHLLHIHFTALMFSANMIWIIEAWAAPRRCLETHSRVWQNWDENTGFRLPDVWSCHISGIQKQWDNAFLSTLKGQPLGALLNHFSLAISLGERSETCSKMYTSCKFQLRDNYNKHSKKLPHWMNFLYAELRKIPQIYFIFEEKQTNPQPQQNKKKPPLFCVTASMCSAIDNWALILPISKGVG